ncbi:ABC transporter permease [Euzebya sp.]|uniref:ABC transporter permease n=1 Tax=Euzebya sp. TaxID=1971409 RepID=UPI0035142FBC
MPRPDVAPPTSTADGARGARVRALVRKPEFWGVVAILGLLGLNLLNDPGYLELSYSANTGGLTGNLIDILRASAPILMISVGMCLVIATEGIDLSVGSLMAVSGAVAMEIMSSRPDTLGAALLAIALGLALCVGLGVLNGLLIAVVGLQPFITTLVMLLAGRGLAKVITSGLNTTASNDAYRWVANGYVLGLPVVFVLAVAITAAVMLVVRRSALGLMIESLGINAEASRLAGIKRRDLLITVYAASGLLAGVAGIFATSTVMTVDVSQTGYQLELDAILAVVIGGTSLAGGTFSLTGAAVGALLIATLDKTVVFLGVPSSATPAFKAVVIIALYIAQSERARAALPTFGRRRRDEVTTP